MDLRLGRVCEYVVGDTVCDIGCDHGKLCAKLLITGKVKTAFGIDVSDASLDKSRRLKYKLQLSSFHLLVGDGFEPVLDKDIDCGVICGIGSNETIGIIQRQIEFAKKLQRLILCPLKNTYTVREFLIKNGFDIEDEDMVFENGRYYNIFICRYKKIVSYNGIDDVDIFVGRALINKGHPLIKQWLESRIDAMESNMATYDDGVKTERADKRNNLERMYKAYVRGLELCR